MIGNGPPRRQRTSRALCSFPLCFNVYFSHAIDVKGYMWCIVCHQHRVRIDVTNHNTATAEVTNGNKHRVSLTHFSPSVHATFFSVPLLPFVATHTRRHLLWCVCVCVCVLFPPSAPAPVTSSGGGGGEERERARCWSRASSVQNAVPRREQQHRPNPLLSP